MSVYVDDARNRFGRMVMCHMAADTTEELLTMADRIGIQRRWLQHPGEWKEHFDISRSKRALAIRAGAISLSGHDCGRLMRSKRTRTTKPTSDPEAGA